MKLYLSSLFFLLPFSLLAQGDLCPCMLQDDPLTWEQSAPPTPPVSIEYATPPIYQIEATEPTLTDEPIFLPEPMDDMKESDYLEQQEENKPSLAQVKRKKSRRIILPKRKSKLRRYSGQCPAF